MRFHLHPLGNAIRRNRLILQDGLLLLALMAVAALITFEYDVFPNAPGVLVQEQVIELDEALGLAALLCIGLLALSWRFLLSQRREVARRIEAEGKARELALQDALTGLPNRRQLEDKLRVALGAPPRQAGAHAMLLLDLNDFKRVNDVYGHGAGDQVLIAVAMRLRRAVREGDLVARLGGDEFAILACQLAGPEDATSIALRVIAELDQPIVLGSTRHQIGVGIGIALIPRDADTADEILRKADVALYRAKAEPRSALRFFDTEMDASTRERNLIERELRSAISSGAVQAYYQPLIDLNTNQIVGFEALARWTHPTLGEIAPERFIPISESCELVTELTDALLAQAARAAREWADDTTLSFNLPAILLKDKDLARRFLSILAEAGLAPNRLEIELTEAALVSNLEGAQEALGGLRDAGVRIALDDFGTGYSSLYHLRNFKIDKVKIDRSFIAAMENQPEAATLVSALLGLGQGLGLTVTAEGVEQATQATTLLGLGCHQAQGHLYGRAMSDADVRDFIASHRAETDRTIVRAA